MDASFLLGLLVGAVLLIAILMALLIVRGLAAESEAIGDDE